MCTIERLVLAIGLAALTTVEARAQEALEVAPVFGDHMVLQRDAPLAVWGTAAPGAEVDVRFGDSSASATTRPDGSWDVALDAQDASREARTLSVRSGDRAVSFEDVVVGEVWLCAGQSNMAFALSRSVDFERASKEADRPSLRLFDRRLRLSMGRRPFSTETVTSLDAAGPYERGEWARSDLDAASPFSAVAWTFGSMLERDLDVPVGLVHVAVGGSPIESWLPRSAMTDDDRLRPLLDDWIDNPLYPAWPRGRARLHLSKWLEDHDGDPPPHPFEPCVLFEAAVAPIARFPVRGVIWYQGESNATEDGSLGRPVPMEVNEHKIRTLVDGWRRELDADGLPFLMAQLPALDREWPAFREAQARVAHGDPDVHLAVTIDVGHPSDVHPRRKRPVGERLARLALANVYGRELAATGPRFERLEAGADGRVSLRFASADGLGTVDGKPPREFAVAAADRVFWPAAATIAGRTVVLTCESVERPVAVRYAWRNDPDVNLVNAAGLPAAPFRTDDWPLEPKIRVACIGDSITFGTGIDGRRRNTYPARLGALLGPDYAVRNFGRPGAGVVRRSMRGKEKRAYAFSKQHAAALAWEPDVVVSNLGVNDVMDWDRFGRVEFVGDYRALLAPYRGLRTAPQFLLWTPLTPLFEGNRFHGDPLIDEIHAAIVRVAAAEEMPTVDLGAPLAGRSALFPDGIHPDADGARRIAAEIARAVRARGLGRD